MFITDARVPRLAPSRRGERRLDGVANSVGLRAGNHGNGDRLAQRHEGQRCNRVGPWHHPDLSLVPEESTPSRQGRRPVFRQRITELYCLRKVNDWTGTRAAADMRKNGSSPLASLGKLAMSEILHSAGRLHGHLLGLEAALDGDQNPVARDANYSQLNAYFTSIGGHRPDQRNIIGEQVLGLPRSPKPIVRSRFATSQPTAGRSTQLPRPGNVRYTSYTPSTARIERNNESGGRDRRSQTRTSDGQYGRHSLSSRSP
ncbi:MAG: hypothetical protein R2706_12970 [Acidimicrobiales bacterium]